MTTLPNKLKVYAPNATAKAEVLKSLHECMIEHLRPYELGGYIHGVMNRHTKRAVLAVMRSRHARRAVNKVVQRTLREKTNASD